jgi:hypothetical protein
MGKATDGLSTLALETPARKTSTGALHHVRRLLLCATVPPALGLLLGIAIAVAIAIAIATYLLLLLLLLPLPPPR